MHTCSSHFLTINSTCAGEFHCLSSLRNSLSTTLSSQPHHYIQNWVISPTLITYLDIVEQNKTGKMYLKLTVKITGKGGKRIRTFYVETNMITHYILYTAVNLLTVTAKHLTEHYLWRFVADCSFLELIICTTLQAFSFMSRYKFSFNSWIKI